MENNSTLSAAATRKTGRREIALACASRPISAASNYYTNHGTLTRVYAKGSKKAKAEARRKELLNG